MLKTLTPSPMRALAKKEKETKARNERNRRRKYDWVDAKIKTEYAKRVEAREAKSTPPNELMVAMLAGETCLIVWRTAWQRKTRSTTDKRMQHARNKMR